MIKSGSSVLGDGEGKKLAITNCSIGDKNGIIALNDGQSKTLLWITNYSIGDKKDFLALGDGHGKKLSIANCSMDDKKCFLHLVTDKVKNYELEIVL